MGYFIVYTQKLDTYPRKITLQPYLLKHAELMLKHICVGDHFHGFVIY